MSKPRTKGHMAEAAAIARSAAQSCLSSFAANHRMNSTSDPRGPRSASAKSPDAIGCSSANHDAKAAPMKAMPTAIG